MSAIEMRTVVVYVSGSRDVVVTFPVRVRFEPEPLTVGFCDNQVGTGVAGIPAKTNTASLRDRVIWMLCGPGSGPYWNAVKAMLAGLTERPGAVERGSGPAPPPPPHAASSNAIPVHANRPRRTASQTIVSPPTDLETGSVPSASKREYARIIPCLGRAVKRSVIRW